ncbi:hypothetical protein NC653_027802 [Populus alba x Populus x berolinensis]|uniref:Uncharacterized protein n=1 Tax=Populus alba x Populus x berolinensis TaxID=444605 RepID=A0AAD6M6Y9_9ROSI|nr:hypothetical protein NC653_027802 [Populus alba x Populus x berolinensis]
MGCAGSSQAKSDGNVKKIRKPKPWKHPQPITKCVMNFGILHLTMVEGKPFTRNFPKHKPLDTTPLLGRPKYWKPYRGGDCKEPEKLPPYYNDWTTGDVPCDFKVPLSLMTVWPLALLEMCIVLQECLEDQVKVVTGPEYLHSYPLIKEGTERRNYHI